MWTFIVLTLGMVLAGPLRASAQDVATSFDTLQRLVKSGDTLEITGADGRRTTGRLGELTASSLQLLARQTDRDGREKLVPKATLSEHEIARIRLEHRDSIWSGTLIGAAIGAGPWLVVGAMAAAGGGGCGGSDSNICPTVALFTGPIGAGIGAAIDASLKKRTTVYSSLGTTIAERADPLWNGMLIGFGVGSIPVALIGLGASAPPGEVAAVAAGYGGIGLLTGLLIDALNKDEATIPVPAPQQRSSEVRVFPLLSKSTAGVRMSVGF